MTNKLTLGDGVDTSSVVLDGGDGSFKSIRFQTVGDNRWIVRSNNVSESGLNVGSNFEILRRDDIGASLGKPLVIDRDTGFVGLNDTANPGTALAIGSGALEIGEMVAPSGVTNTVRLYAEDNGAGKTRLMAVFATGVPVQIAIEP